MSRRVTEDLSRLSPRAARAQVEDTFGARLHGWVLRAEVSITELARALGMHRKEVYDLFEGARPFKGAWIDLLPEALRRVALEDLAGEFGYELRPRAELAEDHCDDRAAADLVREACGTIQATTATLADRQIDRREAQVLLGELDKLEVAMAPMRARLRQVIERGGASLSLAKKEQG